MTTVSRAGIEEEDRHDVGEMASPFRSAPIPAIQIGAEDRKATQPGHTVDHDHPEQVVEEVGQRNLERGGPVSTPVTAVAARIAVMVVPMLAPSVKG